MIWNIITLVTKCTFIINIFWVISMNIIFCKLNQIWTTLVDTWSIIVFFFKEEIPPMILSLGLDPSRGVGQCRMSQLGYDWLPGSSRTRPSRCVTWAWMDCWNTGWAYLPWCKMDLQARLCRRRKMGISREPGFRGAERTPHKWCEEEKCKTHPRAAKQTSSCIGLAT